MPRYKDITGQKFGRLTVIEMAGKDKHQKILWKCKCDCGNEVIVVGCRLRKGHTKSCGCLQKEKASEQLIKLNEVQKGELHPMWNPNITDEEREFGRNIQGYDEWAKEVKERANYTCDCCGKSDGRKFS